MRRLRKTVLWVLAGLVVVAAAAGMWIYAAVFLPTDIALRHAEAFLFRRMAIAELAEEATYRFFFATNRRQTAGAGPIERRFGAERQETLTFGSFDTKIEPSLGIGMLINPTEWFQNEEISLERIGALQQQGFVETLSRLVAASPRRSLMVVVHGFREAFPSALRKTAFVGHVLDINTPVLVFDWPGDQGSSLQGYRRAREVAKASSADFAEFLALLLRQVRPERLWVIANSMGAQVVADALPDLYADGAVAETETLIEDIILTAPDIDHDAFDPDFKAQIAAMVRNLTVYVSSNDRALIMSRLVNRTARRGESTLTPDQIEEAVLITEMIDPDDELIALVDVTPVNRTRNFHNFSLETPEFFDDLFLRLTNRVTPHTRRLYKVQAPNGARYWVLTRGR